MLPWTYGMIDMSPAAIEGRRIHAICNKARTTARAAAVIEFANRDDVKQAALDADQIGQRAYWQMYRELRA